MWYQRNGVESMSLFKKKFKKDLKSPLWKSFYYAFYGIGSALKEERNLCIHFIVMLLVIVGGFYFRITRGEWMTCMLLFGLVISLELMNTAIEATIDLCHPEIHPKAKLAKDTAAGSVLVAAIVAIVVGILIFYPYFSPWIS